jgi:hypothetical protein
MQRDRPECISTIGGETYPHPSPSNAGVTEGWWECLVVTRTWLYAWGLRRTSRHSRTLVLGIAGETRQAPTLWGNTRVHEELVSVREDFNLSSPQALDEAEHFLVEQGYVVVRRTATTLMVEREDAEGAAA